MRLPSHHGAASSLTTTTAATTTTRPRRFHGGGFLRCRGQRKRLFSSAVSKGVVFTLRTRKMVSSPAVGGKQPQKGVWHFSHGFVFANDTRVAYPQLPSVRHYGAPALAPRDEDASGSAVGELHPNVVDVEELHPNVVDVVSVGAEEQKTAVVDSTSVGAETNVPAVTEETHTSVEAVAAEEDPAEPAPFTIPFQPLDFKIPDDAFEAALNAPEGSPESFWTYALYRGPPGEDGAPGPKVKVHYCTSQHTTERVIRQYFMNEKLLGFDLEWEIKSTKAQGVRRNVSLVQLASESRIALFHLALYPKKDSFVAPALKEIMENPEITKVGVWIKGDASRLRTFMDIDCRGLFELSHLYRLIECVASGGVKKPGKKLQRMAIQVEEYLHLPLFKGSDVRTSKWSQPLEMNQIIYSASDAYAAVQLYAALNHARTSLDPVPPLPHHAELDLPIRLADRLADRVVDLPADEQEQPDVDEDAEPPTTSAAFAKYAESLGATHSIELEDEDSLEEEGTVPTKRTRSVATAAIKRAPKKPAAPKPPRDPRVEEAELWARQYLVAQSATAGTDTSMVMLRAYYLWHSNEGLDVDGVAGLLRDPPLATTTVAGYIVGAIRAEKLPFDKRRLLEGVLEKLPAAAFQRNTYRAYMALCRKEVGSGR